ncbi:MULTISPECIES: hypothetical protein [Hydrotalea]|uniref:hypothetical protein n=1 Tax=Hydrotalea TaxID=1004300 RepID=UPI001C463BA3|nr:MULTISPECIES: hypothetical protein [Hydrotalea]
MINGSLADEDLLNRTILHFKDDDNRTGIIAVIENKYGKAFWDLSVVLKDKNGTFTLATPIINSKNKVTALLFGSERNRDYTFFRLIDKATPQNYLAKHGDIKATAFTQSTLYGIFNAIESNWKHIVNRGAPQETQNRNAATMSLRHVEMYVAVFTDCWTYSYTYPADSYGGIGIAIGTQCQTNAMYIDNGSNSSGSSGLGATTPVHSGGGGRGSITTPPPPMLLADIKNELKDPCLNTVANNLITSTFKNTVTDILQNIFNVNDKLNIYFQENTTREKEAWTQPGTLSNRILDEIVYVNPNLLHDASQEYIASLLIHEIIHTYLDVNTTLSGNMQQHPEMLKNYIEKMSLSLLDFYKNITLDQARALCIAGFGDLQNFQDFNNILESYGFNTDPASTRNIGFFIQPLQSGSAGTKCN